MKKIDLFLQFRKLGSSRSRGLHLVWTFWCHSLTRPVLSPRQQRVTKKLGNMEKSRL